MAAKRAAGKVAPAAKATAAAKASTKISSKPTKTAASPKAKTATSESKTNGTASKKRKAELSAASSDDESAAPQKKAKIAAASVEKAPLTAQPKRKTQAVGPKINNVPSQVLDVYVFGEGTSGELGLGSKRVNGKKPVDVKRPRLNDNLSADKVGIVQIACGGMHVIALTKDNQILTWGVNDQGALGRDTNWDGGLRDVDDNASSDSEDEDDTGMNPLESTPTAVISDSFIPGTNFVQVVASDSASFALTEDGRVYGWGTFRSSDGILGFSKDVRVQREPVMVPELKNITSLAAGANHILALDNKNHILAWGCGQQNQLGRRIIERNKMSSLIPQGVRAPRGKINKIACGAYHSFLIDHKGQAWGWGLNNFGEIGSQGNAGQDEAVILHPTKLGDFEDNVIVDIDGGVHHSVACNDKGELFAWGRVDGYQVGFELDKLSRDDVIFDNRDNPRILVKPTIHKDVSNITSVAAGTDNSFAVSGDGKVYSWGFSSNYQTGQGTLDDIHIPTLIDNTAIRGKQIISAGAGGQYSILTGVAEGASKVNGHK